VEGDRSEYILPAIHTKTTAQLSELTNSFEERDVIAGHVRSITFAEKLSEEWPDQSNASAGNDTALLRQESASSPCDKTFLLPFKRLKRLAFLDGRLLPTIAWPSGVPFDSVATTKQLENLQPALSSPSVHLRELCVEWVDIRFFLSKADELGQMWRSLTTLRLAPTCNGDLNGLRDLSLVLRGLSNLMQLHLSVVEDLHLPLYLLIDERRVAWSRLTHLTLQGFVAREAILQRLFSLPRLRSVSIARITVPWMTMVAASRF
jgi:hypothetical protein